MLLPRVLHPNHAHMLDVKYSLLNLLGHSEDSTMSSLTGTLIKKKRKFSSYIRKCRAEQLQSHTYEEGLPEEMRKYFPIYEEAVSHI
jgi:hypothetical protein